MTKIDENYMDIKPQTNMLISEGWRAYRHDRLFTKVYNTFWHKFGCNTYLFNINCKPNLATSLVLHCNVNDVTFCAKLTEGSCL